MKSIIMKYVAVMMIFGFIAATGAIAGESVITGTVQKTDNRVVIAADDGGTYNVMGADLTEMIGKTVKATGTLTDSANGKVLTLISVEPIKK